MIVHFTGSEWCDCTDSVFSIFPSGWSYWWSHCSIIVLWGVSLYIWCSLQWCTGWTNIYTLSTHYLHNIYKLSTHYLHTIYSLSIHYLHSVSIWCSQRWCTGCRLRHLSPRRIHRWRTIWKHTGPHYPQLHPATSNLPLGVYQVPQVAVVGAEIEESIPGIFQCSWKSNG